jgi:hypothetical protein
MSVAAFKNFIDNFSKLDLGKEQQRIINNNKDELLRLQLKQFEEGVDSKSEPILLEGKGYNPWYADKKRKYGIGIGQITDHVTLYLTGDLYRETFIQITNKEFYFTSRVPYFPELMRRTGDVTGLNLPSRQYFAEKFVLTGIEIVLKSYGLTLNKKILV